MGLFSPRRMAIALVTAVVAAPLAACSGDGDPLAKAPYDASGDVVWAAGTGTKKADPGKPLEITVKGDGKRITDVTATDASGRFIRGRLSEDGRHWQSTSALGAGAHYTVRVSTEDKEGRQGRKTLALDTRAPDKLLRVTFGPEAGTYGVGQPVTAELSAPVKDINARIAVERSLHVDSSPSAGQGAWYWVDDRTLHYRPRAYWPAHARIEVRSTLDGLHIKGGMYGGPAKPLTLRTGDRVEALTDASTHTMTFKRNGRVVRTIPVTTGKPGFSTRNGIKVVLGQEAHVRMRSETVGIASGSSDAYDLPVEWATRVTWSGEYVHAAPWSVGSQGVANVSHGCTGMSTENAHWFFENVRRGDIVVVTHSLGEEMAPFGNGFGDWNLSWADWRKGSAAGARAGSDPAAADDTDDPQARLRPVL
ncbi:Ig-like domain-containing protein [Streptomyces sp. NPDC046977]|uniref:L,D-transpeptidase n=1 Tax=Streptomyces sp. NPDC046977 TaxID=3154703 RepID=UPI0033CC5BD2